MVTRSATKPDSMKPIDDSVPDESPHACDEDAPSSMHPVSALAGLSGNYLDMVSKGVDALEKNVSKQEFYLPLLNYGPAIFSDPFPSDSYRKLLTKLKALSSTGRRLRRAVTQLGQNGFRYIY